MRSRLATILAVGAAVICVLSLLEPLYSGRTWHSYAQDRRVIRAGVLPLGGSASSYAMYLLSADAVYVPVGGGAGFSFIPPRPPGWEILNPRATPGIDRSSPDYWRVPKAGEGIDTPLLQNYDVLLLPVVGGTANLTVWQQRVLERWVDEGGLLWIDNQPDHPNPGNDPDLGDFFLRPRVQFAPRNRTLVNSPKVGVDLTHPLLRSRFPLSEDDIQLLGQQQSYGAAGAGLSYLDGIIGGVNNPFPPNNAITALTAVQEVVGELYDDPGSGERRRAPVIAAGYYGGGCIVVTACGVAAGMSDWYATLASGGAQASTELPQWAIPDMKLAYNMIQWWMDWSGSHGRVRFRGESGNEAAGPPVVAWQDVTSLVGPLSGPAFVGRGLALAGSYGGVLACWDVDPFLDRDLDGSSDDGVPDYALGAPRDLLWAVTVPWQDPTDPQPPPARGDPARQIVGSPAVVNTYGGSGPARLAAVAVRTLDGNDSSIHAYLADALDAAQLTADPVPVWSATVKHYSITNPADSSGLVNSGPVAVGQFFGLLTTDSGTLDAPNRDAHLLIYDAAGPGALPPILTGTANIPYEQPAAHVEMSEGGRAASFANPPAVAMTTAWDEAVSRWDPVQAAVIVGNSLPRPGPSATGRLWVTPLMVRFPAPGWDRTWQVDPSLPAPDTAANQSVQVTVNGVQIPPHMDDQPGEPYTDVNGNGAWDTGEPYTDLNGSGRYDAPQPLNYIRTTADGQIRIVFTSWSVFGRGQYPLGFDQVAIRYRDTSGNWREMTQKLHPGFPISLGGYVSEAGFATPCVFERNIYVGTDAVNQYPSPSSEGQVACYTMGLERAGAQEWTFAGDRYRGEDPTDPARTKGTYFSSFSYTPSYFEDTLYAVGNYQFFHRDEDQRNEAVPDGPSGALYALQLKASPELVQPGTADPVLASLIDSTAPRNNPDVPPNNPPYSADPNQVVPAGRSGAAVWISTNIDPASDDYNSPRYALPQVAGATVNWRVDFQNRLIRLGSGIFGRLASPQWDRTANRFVPQRVRVRYFSGGAVVDTVMEVTPLVKWMHLAEPGWEFVSSPVIARDMVFVIAYDHVYSRYLLLGFRAVPENSAPGEPLWAHSAAPEYVTVLATAVDSSQPCGLAVTESGLVWSTTIAGVGGAIGLSTPATIIADNERLLSVDTAGHSAISLEAVSHSDPSSGIGAAGIPIRDSYAERTFDPIERPTRARPLPNGNLLVVNAGANSVVELDPSSDIVWQYPSSDADLGSMTEQEARLFGPSDAQRYYYRAPQKVSGADLDDPAGIIKAADAVWVDWVTTLIADAGNSRVIEVARPLLDGRYRPEVSLNWRVYNPADPVWRPCVETVRVLAGPDPTIWPVPGGATTRIRADFTTAAEGIALAGGQVVRGADATYPFLSSSVLCAVGNHPDDPVKGDKYVRLVEVAVTYGAGATVATSRVVPRPDTPTPEGINVFRPRIIPWMPGDQEQLERDFLNVHQADQVVAAEWDAQTQKWVSHLATLIVDDVGVKLVDNATWNATLTPRFEMRGIAPWLRDAASRLPGDSMTTYEEEMAGGVIASQDTPTLTRKQGQEVLGLGRALSNWVAQFGNPPSAYPPLIQEPRTGYTPAEWDALRADALRNAAAYAQATAVAGAQTGEVPFLPFYAAYQRDGTYLIVSAYPTPYLSTGPLDVMAPVTSEVFEVDPTQPVGQRVVKSWDAELNQWESLMWSHFMVPDPARSEYPMIRGGAAPLRQPRSAERR